MAAVQEDVTPLSPTLPQNILQDFGDNHCEVVHCQWLRPRESSTENFSSPGGGGGLRALNSFLRGPPHQEWWLYPSERGYWLCSPQSTLNRPPWNSEPAGVFQEHPQIKATVHPDTSWSSPEAFPHAELQTQQISPWAGSSWKKQRGKQDGRRLCLLGEFALHFKQETSWGLCLPKSFCLQKQSP